MSGNPTYSKQIIEIADILFAEPDKKIAGIMRDFAVKCGKSPKTIERWIKKAKEYNLSRIETTEKAKTDILVEAAKESIKRDILSREQAEEILSDIARKKAVKVGDTTMVPTSSEQVRAIDKLAAMKGWDAPVKSEITGKDGAPLNPEPLVIEIIDSRDKVDVDESTDN